MIYLFLECFYQSLLKFREKSLDKQINRFNKEYIIGSGITLINNEINDITKVVKSLENRGILIKGTAIKINNIKKEVSQLS